MKRFVKITAAFVLAALSVFVFSFSAFADGTVTYDGNSQDFVFEPGTNYSPTDLFDTYKDVMPGDTLTQKVTVKNNSSDKVKATIYLRSLGAHDDSVDFLSKLSLTVKAEGNTELFEAPASETAQLTDWVCLGTLYTGGTVDLDLELSVPNDLDNDFQSAIGKLDWQFKVDETPIEVDGDKSNVYLYIAVFCAAVLVLTVVLLFLLKRRKEER